MERGRQSASGSWSAWDAGLFLLGWSWAFTRRRTGVYCPALVLTRLSGLSSLRRETAMTSSCSVCSRSTACKRLGCCCFLLLPLSVTAEYAGAHDSAILSTFAAQTSVSAYWASWADCLPVLRQHLPRAAQAFLRDLGAPVPLTPSSALRIGLPPAGVSSVTARRRRHATRGLLT